MADNQEKDAEKLDIAASAAKALDLERWDEDPELDRRLNRKFDMHILPWLFGIW